MDEVKIGSRISVAIPAMNEEACIGAALQAFTGQRELDDRELDPRAFDIVVLANGCTDATASEVRRFKCSHPSLSVAVVSCDLPEAQRHVGTARRMALDIAADRQRGQSGNAGIVASTDADSIVHAQWIAQTLHEIRNVEAVAGHVDISRDDRDRMPAAARLLYDRERTYQRLRADVESWLDPRPYDPPPRHDLFVGTSFAVRVDAYDAAGKLPMLPKLEDLSFARALRRIDARVRHSYHVRVETSARCDARVDGGFASMLASFRELGMQRRTVFVQSAERTILRARARAGLRSFWKDARKSARTMELARTYGVDVGDLFALVDPRKPFGMALEALEATLPSFENLPDEAIEDAIRALQQVRAKSQRADDLDARAFEAV